METRSINWMEAAELLPKRDPNGHKGTFGKVLVIGGSHGMAGAAYFSAYAALLMGAGMVRIATHEDNRIIYQIKLPEAMLSTYDEHHFEDVVFDALRWADTVLIGPGLSQQSLEREVFNYAFEKAIELSLPMVIDADGLNFLAKNINKEPKDGQQDYFYHAPRSTILSAGVHDENNPSIILTPHLGEMSRLTGKPISEIASDMPRAASDFADRYNVIVHLKSAQSVTAAPNDPDIILNTGGNDGMATAGSGDVLAGMIAGLLVQGVKPKVAAALGAYLHGLCGDTAAEQVGHASLTASDLLTAIQRVLRGLGLQII